MAYAYVLVPGRHRQLTRFQAAYLERAVAVGVPDATSAASRSRVGRNVAAGAMRRSAWPDTHLRLVARRPAA